MRWRALDAYLFESDKRWSAVDGTPETVEHTAKQLFSDTHGKRSPSVLDKCPDAKSCRIPIGQAGHAVAVERHDLGENRVFTLT